MSLIPKLLCRSYVCGPVSPFLSFQAGIIMQNIAACVCCYTLTVAMAKYMGPLTIYYLLESVWVCVDDF